MKQLLRYLGVMSMLPMPLSHCVLALERSTMDTLFAYMLIALASVFQVKDTITRWCLIFVQFLIFRAS